MKKAFSITALILGILTTLLGTATIVLGAIGVARDKQSVND